MVATKGIIEWFRDLPDLPHMMDIQIEKQTENETETGSLLWSLCARNCSQHDCCR